MTDVDITVPVAIGTATTPTPDVTVGTGTVISVPVATASGVAKTPGVTVGTGAVISVPVATAVAAALIPDLWQYPIIEFLDSNDVRVSEVFFESLYPGRESAVQTINMVNHHHTMDLDVTITALLGILGGEMDTVKSTLISDDNVSYALETETITALAASETPFYLKWHPPSNAKIGEKEWSLRVALEGWTPPSGLEDWPYYGRFTVYGSVDGVLTDHQVEKRVYYHPGMNMDFSDLRFYLSDGTKLDYGIFNQVVGEFVDVGVKIPSLPASPGSLDIYVFCGNSSATTDNDPTNTYLFFDDATGVYSDKWSAGAEYIVYDGRNSLDISNGDYAITATGFTLNRPFNYKFDFEMATNSSLFVEYFLAAGDDYHDKYHILLNGDGTYYIRKNYSTLKSGYYSYLPGWNTFQMTLDNSGVHNFFLNNNPVITVTDNTYTNGLIGFGLFSLYTRHTYISKIRISEYTPNPPIVGGFEGWNLNTDIVLKGGIQYQSQDLPGYNPVIRYGCRVGGVLYE